MHEDLCKVNLTALHFEDQPACWRNMILELEQQGSFIEAKDAYNLINSRLQNFGLIFCENIGSDGNFSYVQGTRANLTEWILHYS